MLSTFFSRTMTASALAICVALTNTPLHAQTYIAPDDQTVALLAAYLSDNTPNFREDALASREYRRANEFDKPQVLQDVEDNLRTQYERIAEIGGLELRVSGNIGQYDAASGAYRISVFEPGTYFPFAGDHALHLDNAADFYEWELPVAEARRVRELSPRGGVVLELSIVPFAITPNNPHHIRTQIVALKMFERNSGQLLYETSLPEDAHKDIQTAAAQTPDIIDQSQLELVGVHIGMPVADALEALRSEGYAVGDDLNVLYRFSTYEDGLDEQLLPFGVSPSPEYMRIRAAFPHSAHFTPDLTCGDDTQLHSCGVVYFDPSTREVQSIALLQNATNVTKQDLVSTLFERFGSASDRFTGYLWKNFAADQYVWGGAADAEIYNHSFTEISGPNHWQVEAIIAEPTTDRKTVIVQINQAAPQAVVSGNGGIKF
ncbi:hypothetical protein [Yoonia sp. I 8.24]|uniref:hypothetical protein n=1 Tax=Yoonia sp. I 8.24 TaxID=1537229 RepID=UPI001EDD27E8|nr:hypothetical protein [Yoonia sp. I 8.24]MCG3267165.1 hypothetical protein [Yoonia sp. I 8.24]